MSPSIFATPLPQPKSSEVLEWAFPKPYHHLTFFSMLVSSRPAIAQNTSSSPMATAITRYSRPPSSIARTP
ncbi:RNase Z [Apiospora aurea]|uniref:RNase Z n=1 Tax=Apiospora aurea TaxID=335848 RepID=A0ABR1QZ50_9PEZI